MFVLDLDDYAFKYFTTSSIKQLLTSLPPLGTLPPGADVPEGVDASAAWAGFDDAIWQILAGWVLGPTLIALATALYQGWCGDDEFTLALGFGLPAALVLSSCFACRFDSCSAAALRCVSGGSA